MSEPIKSRRGVYYDLTKSPYEYKTPYGDVFKFSSQKKLDMYTKRLPTDILKVENLLERYELKKHIPIEITHLLLRTIYKVTYEKIER